MIIIIDEASAKLASFYYHGEIFKLQWRSVAGKASMSEELQEKLYGALPGKVLDELQKKLPDEQQNNLCVYEIENNSGYTESADNTAKANTGNLRIPKAPADCIWIVSNRQQKQIADALGIASVETAVRPRAMQSRALQSLILSIWSGCAGGIITSRGTSARQTGV